MTTDRRDFVIGSLAASLMGKTQASGSIFSHTGFGDRRSRPLTGVRVGIPIRLPENSGDTWIGAWAEDGNVYSPSNDTKGFHKACDSNIAFNVLKGDDAFRLSGTTVNSMPDYGDASKRGPDRCTWKSSGCIWIDGALYWVVGRHLYGEDGSDPYKRQTAQNASIVRSTDFGKSWKRTAQDNYDFPMFPGQRFATPYFIQYGYGHREVTEDNAGKYIYAMANNGFWDCGDDMVLGRVARSKISLLNGHDWEFYTGKDGMMDVAWSPHMNAAAPILANPRRFGMTGAVYLPSHHRYFMIGWYYPAGGGKIKDACLHTIWDFYEAPRPWGPWTLVGSSESTPAGWYCPEVIPKFQTANRVFAFTAGNWSNADSYRLTIVPLDLAI
jgi:hypothetical protein